MYAWRRDDEGAGHSVGRLAPVPDGWVAHGAETLVADEVVACGFRVELDASWRTRSAVVHAVADAGGTALALAVVEADWTIDGAPAPRLRGCVDVDIAATPLTNTFPIRRFADLAIGESRTTPVAWVEVPSLRVLRVEQTYERLGPRTWRYSDPQHGAFVLEVDADGVVERYEGFAVRVAG